MLSTRVQQTQMFITMQHESEREEASIYVDNLARIQMHRNERAIHMNVNFY